MAAILPTPKTPHPPPFQPFSFLISGRCFVAKETATWVVVSLCVLQVQTLYYSADHKLLDRALLDGQVEVFGAEEDHIQFVQVHGSQPARLD